MYLKKFLYLIVLLQCLPFGLFAQTKVGLEIMNEATINTDQLEFSPTFYEDGIVFISNKPLKDKEIMDKRIDKNVMSIFIARRGLDGVLKPAEPYATELTSKLHEGPLCFDKTTDNVYFTRNNIIKGRVENAKDGYTKLGIFTAERVAGKWGEVREMPFNNREYDFCHPSISIDGDKVFFSSNRPGGYGGMDLYYSQKINGKWSEPINLGPTINSDKNEVFPFIHADGTLFFSSNKAGGKGGLDLYFSKSTDEVWAEPMSMSPELNSELDDFGLIVDSDLKNGYFTSGKSGGKGLDDIYSFHTDGKITEPTVIGKPGEEVTFFIADKVNGTELDGATISVMSTDDIANVVTDENGNVISLGNGKMTPVEANVEGTDKEGKSKVKLKKDLDYVVTVKKPGYKTKQFVIKKNDSRSELMTLMDKADDCITVNGFVLGNKKNPIPGATVTIKDDVSGEMLTFTSDLKGNFNFCVPCGKNYTIQGEKDNYLPATAKVSTLDKPCNPNTIVSAELVLADIASPENLAEGTTYELQNIYYNFNDATLRPDAKIDLDVLSNLMKRYPSMEIEIGSHTDSRGTDEYNKSLSQKRADNVIAYLSGKGILKSRVKAVGYGETKLRNECGDGAKCSEYQHQINRRTEVKITKSPSDEDVGLPEFLSEKNLIGGGGVGAMATLYNTLDGLKGDFAVISGSFENEANADKQIENLTKAGFDNLSIVNPPKFPFHRVLVQRVPTIKDARILVVKLKAKGFASFLLRA